ncbi:hypothetical protein H2201_000982 [Coniosporium apollinis]|uniref:AAA+ ATPase domain-containing protein n=1 Tax=Coniosporium apollinis TaxID=61459 RepID=A0ABQ9P781_9PEZI|nr:hypothetical protein H2201_000982 [Coniosporium apollinis]
MDGREKRKKQRGMPRRSRQQPHSSRNTVTPSTEEQATGGVRSKGGRENDETAVHPFKSGRNSRETTGNTISRDHTVDIKELSRRVLSSTLESQSEKPQSKTIPEEEEDFVFAADNRNVQAGPPSNSQGNHTLQDYTMQLMLLEQQNMKRLLMARQEREHELSLNQPSPDSGNKESESGRNQQGMTEHTISQDRTAETEELIRRALSLILQPQSETLPEEEGASMPKLPLNNGFGGGGFEGMMEPARSDDIPSRSKFGMRRSGPRGKPVTLPWDSPTGGHAVQYVQPPPLVRVAHASVASSAKGLVNEDSDPSPSTGYVVRKGLNKHLTLEPLEQAASPADDEAWYTSSEREEPDEHPEMPGQEATYSSTTDCWKGWRDVVCLLVKENPDLSDLALLKAVTAAQGRLSTSYNDQISPQPTQHNAQYCILHRINCADAEGPPRISQGRPYFVSDDEEVNHLRCHTHDSVPNIEVYIAQNPHLSFIAFRDYRCCDSNDTEAPASNPTRGKEPEHSSESVQVISVDLHHALLVVTECAIRRELYPKLHEDREICGPYLWMFHEEEHIRTKLSHLPSNYRKQMTLFLEYIRDHLHSEYAAVRQMLGDGVMCDRYLDYIFMPGEIIIEKNGGGDEAYDKACLQASWLLKKVTSQPVAGSEDEFTSATEIIFHAHTWKFDGHFSRAIEKKSIQSPVSHNTYLIRDMVAYPIRYAKEGTKERLLRRGKMFWDCRFRRYVSYCGWNYNHNEYTRNVRFMIDIDTFRLTHPEADFFRYSDRLKNDLESAVMERDEPPSEEFLMLLPNSAFGFNMQEKQWVKLLVDYMLPVEWNKAAFRNLALDDETKELITALITNKIESEKSTDLMAGKGNGLIMLLHGGPGTGKTYTAEGVAELAEKPLYRVTCGDIGTNPVDVEKYLTKVLLLGKIWNCVVLLDEAEVFLQERNLEDLQRNALVSVFLRVLEYYDGILILTSNRVATFDEAFKSRIQLALRYEPLQKGQRKQIWSNFLERLESFEAEKIDIKDLHAHLEDLSQYEMNGRQIRNVVTTARQLATYKKRPMDFEALRHVINVSSKFDKYMKNVNEGLSDEDIAREDRIR